MRIEPLSAKIFTSRTPRRTEVKNVHHTTTLKSAENTTSINVPTGRAPRSTEVENASHKTTLKSANSSFSVHVPTGRTSRSTEVRNASRMSALDDGLINCILTTCVKYFKPKTMPTVDSIRAILKDAYVSTDENYGIEDAIEWANGFEIPSSAVASDMRKFRAAGLDFKTMVRRQISTNAANRLSKKE